MIPSAPWDGVDHHDSRDSLVRAGQGPKLIGKYWLLDELGAGGMAVVYLGVMRGMNAFTKLVVLKVLRSQMMDSADAVRMFMTEARLTARLNHPNIVQTYEATDADGHCMIVMEYLDGVTLEEVMAIDSLGVRGLALKLKVLMGALRGLHYAHELVDFDGSPLAVVHRDISPHNVFATFDGQTKVLDFGIAKLAQSQHTEIGVIKGKVRYMSPEQACADEVDRRTDVFAAGVILWEILAGRPLWHGKGDIQILRWLLSEKHVPSPRTVNVGIGPTLEQICMRSLAFDVSERFESCEAMHEALAKALMELPPEAQRVELSEVLTQVFGAEREKRRAKIAAQLSNLKRDERWQSLAPGPTPRPREENSTDELGTTTTRRRVGKRGVALAVAGVSLAGALGAWLLSTASPKLSHEPVTVVSAARAPTSAPEPEPVVAPALAPEEDLVTLTISVDPPHATLSWEGLPMGESSLVRREPRNSGARVVQAAAAGYKSESRTVGTSTDAKLDLKLERIDGPRPASRVGATRTPRPAPAASVSSEELPMLPLRPKRPTSGAERPKLDTESPW